ncbi:hypothetical protein LJR225_000886 [Phenylobacterium sp. LjRoot225]|uniref:surface-adhesin E family protein n=1 Tax=Phenylobacterium sp. LjRoot225 TaxID=3342285 RepID=UPI003ECD01F4
MRKALAFLAMFVGVFATAPALAAPSPGLELAAWVSQNTDLPVSQIAIAGRENVYSLEPLGPRVSTGEVLALVRTEAVAAEWSAAHDLQSWDAHILFDCSNGRLRVLRSASYAEPHWQGLARSNDVGEAWFSPEVNTPAATLLSAACDPAFAWPLRESAAPSKPAPKAEPALIQAASPDAPAPALQVAQISAPEEARPSQGEKAVDVAATRETPPAVERVRLAEAAPLRPVLQASVAVEPQLSGSVQKASYISRPTVREPATVEETVAAPRRAGVLATTAAAVRKSLRWACGGPGWLARRVEVAFRRGPQPPRSVPGTIRQAQAY